jgi:signal transduction histidine kinase
MLLAILWTKYDNNGTPTATNYAILVFFIGGAWLAGWLVRRRAAQARTALAHSDELARSAVSDERTRIARELHDVVAHSVSIVAVQAGAAEELIERDPAAAREHMRAVRRTAREAMTEMRRLLDVLRTDEPRFAPTPGLSRLGDLLAETRAAGVPVELIEQGPRPELPAGVDLVVFRVVQESLTNVRKHARGAPTQVALRYASRAIEIEVTNPTQPGRHRRNGTDHSRGGHGLIGMRERALLFGGSFDAGERPGHGFRVRVVLPLQEQLA